MHHRLLRRTSTFIALAAVAAAFARPLAAQRPAQIKVNATALVAVPGVAYEIGLGDRAAFNLDATASLWRSIGGVPFHYLMVLPELRYYQRAGHEGFYGGIHVGGSIYRLQKWNYWGTDKYQEGFSRLAGITVGHVAPISPRWTLDAFIGGGNQHGFYRGYVKSTGERYDGDPGLNQSKEWLPYRLGVMFGYRLR